MRLQALVNFVDPPDDEVNLRTLLILALVLPLHQLLVLANMRTDLIYQYLEVALMLIPIAEEELGLEARVLSGIMGSL